MLISHLSASQSSRAYALRTSLTQTFPFDAKDAKWTNASVNRCTCCWIISPLSNESKFSSFLGIQVAILIGANSIHYLPFETMWTNNCIGSRNRDWARNIPKVGGRSVWFTLAYSVALGQLYFNIMGDRDTGGEISSKQTSGPADAVSSPITI